MCDRFHWEYNLDLDLAINPAASECLGCRPGLVPSAGSLLCLGILSALMLCNSSVLLCDAQRQVWKEANNRSS